MANRVFDIVGQKKGLLTILSRHGSYKGKATWIAQCECGNITDKITTGGWNSNRWNSCGCVNGIPDPVPGDQYNNWTVIEKISIPNKRFRCSCICGIESIIAKADLLRGSSKQCLSCSQNLKIKEDNFAAKNRVFDYYKRNANKSGRDFHLTFDEAILIMEQNCHYCNRPPGKIESLASGSIFIHNGIDRKDKT